MLLFFNVKIIRLLKFLSLYIFAFLLLVREADVCLYVNMSVSSVGTTKVTPSSNLVCSLAIGHEVKYTFMVLHERGKGSLIHLGCGGSTEEAFEFFVKVLVEVSGESFAAVFLLQCHRVLADVDYQYIPLHLSARYST